MTRDAQKQSVKCEYHRWIKEGDERDPETGAFAAKCSKCGAAPKGKDKDRAQAILNLREFINPGDTVYTTLRHVSRSGMQRVIDLHVIQNNEPRWIGYMAAKAMDDRYDDQQQGVVVGGCGMDMGFSLVYNLGRTLFADSFACVGEKCPANDHFNSDRNYEPHQHTDGGYALKHRWM